MNKTSLVAAALCIFGGQAEAGWSCTMPSGAVIFSVLSPCPSDAVRAELRDTALPFQPPAPRKKIQAPEVSLPKISVALGEPPIQAPLGPLIGQPKGYILNDYGVKCWYTQTATRGAYFHTIPGQRATLTFDDPRCMRDNGLGLDINKMMINNIVARPYSHADANFQSRPAEMFKTSLLQVRGGCIQSGRYPAIAVVIEYLVSGSSIYEVRHAAGIGPCTNVPSR